MHSSGQNNSNNIIANREISMWIRTPQYKINLHHSYAYMDGSSTFDFTKMI